MIIIIEMGKFVRLSFGPALAVSLGAEWGSCSDDPVKIYFS